MKKEVVKKFVHYIFDISKDEKHFNFYVSDFVADAQYIKEYLNNGYTVKLIHLQYDEVNNDETKERYKT